MSTVQQDVRFETLERVQQMNSGHHLEAATSPGVIIAAGPGIHPSGGDPTRVDPATLPSLGSVLDVTPTVLYLRGLPVGSDMDGRVMQGILDPRLLRERPFEVVATHETGDAEAREELDPALEREMIERFRSLGYVK
jgi:hypothetical protein